MTEPLKNLSHLKKGDRVFFKPSDREGRYLTVTKIGRKWLTIGDQFCPDRERFDIETARQDTQYLRGDLYATEEDYKTHLANSKLKDKLQSKFRDRLYTFTLHQLIAISKIVNLEDS